MSHTLDEVPEHLIEKTTLLKGSPKDILQSIHKRDCYKLYIDGGKTEQDFLEQDLIDELRITTIPIMPGEGIPLFKNMSQSLEFKHLKTEVFLHQIVQSQYERSKRKN